MSQPKHDPHYNRFWFGFAVGGAVCAAFAMAVGTKQGRKLVKKTVDYVEQIEDQPDQLNTLSDMIFSFIDQAASGMPAAETPQKKAEEEKDLNTLSAVIDKMKNITSETKSDKKFFTKTNKK